jgi:aryl-alcohol dehydrogenase-like predicted oxidoreductase
MITIPETDLVVYPLCLGGNVFGWSADEAESRHILDAYEGYGGNFIDTADVYAQWADGNQGGESEEIIGRWMKTRGNRNKMVVATKVGQMKDRLGLSAENIIAACEDSLRRLQVEHIDIYYSHIDDQFVPMEETLGAYAELVSDGKVRYIAASQHSATRLQKALDISLENNLPAYIALQDQYNLMERNPFESEQADVLAKNGLSAVPFYGLARGFLTGKYREGVRVESVRAEGVAKYQTDNGYAVIDALDEIAQEHSSSISAIALAWIRSHSQVSTPIASARTVEQLNEIVEIVDLTEEEITKLNLVSA